MIKQIPPSHSLFIKENEQLADKVRNYSCLCDETKKNFEFEFLENDKDDK